MAVITILFKIHIGNFARLIVPVVLALTTTLFAAIKPNIVVILADDMGYGDVSSFYAEAKTTTPEIDKLALEGMRFTNAHVPGSSCIISRYGLLTGRYPFRRPHFNWNSEPLIEEGRWTLASVLRDNGYQTGMVGKWHLGFNYDDYSNLTGGPVDRGFDYYYGLGRSLDQQDYYYIEGRTAAPPTEDMPASDGYGQNGWQGPFWRAGKAQPGFKHADVLDNFTDKAIEYIQNAQTEDPYFLYLAYASPHTPWLPSENFQGTGHPDLGEWGDWINENDAAFGRVIQAIYDKGEKENTLIIFTSDNGPVWWETDIQSTGHHSTGIYRGMKFDPWEGGHRMPFIASWPGLIQSGQTSNQLISTTDLLATFGALVGQDLPDNMAEDSYNIWPALLDPNLIEPVRGPLIELPGGAAGDPLVIIEGDWKLIEQGNQLYNLLSDPSETTNLYAENAAKVSELKAALDDGKADGHSVSFPRTNTSSLMGCLNPASPYYEPDAVAEPAGYCEASPLKPELKSPLASLIAHHEKSIEVLSPDILSITIRSLHGRSLHKIENPQMGTYYPNAWLHGLTFLEIKLKNGGFSRKFLVKL